MPRPRLEGLTQRRYRVLKAVVEEYVRTARPVGSVRVRELTGLDASPATIRNDMAALQGMGLIYRRHASSGRLPTPRGYRAYLQRAPKAELPEAQRRWLRHFLRSLAGEAEDAARIGARAIAQTTGLAGVAAIGPATMPRLAAASVTLVSDRIAKLSWRLSDGRSGEVLVHLPSPTNRQQADRWQSALSAAQGLSISRAISKLEGLSAELREALLKSILATSGFDVIVEGAANLAAQPEFSSGPALSEVLEAIAAAGALPAALMAAAAGPMGMCISHEQPLSQLRACGLVVRTFSAPAARGMLAVLGPERMDYRLAIAALSEVKAALESAMGPA